MKRISALFLSLILSFSLAVPTLADVLWEPNNRFYEKHRSDCQLLQRSFYVNGEDGYVDLLAAPDSSTVALQLENGEQVYIYWQYENWGYVEIEEDGGWVELDELELIYDHISFAEEYADSIIPYDSALCQPLLDSWDGSTMVMWPYPGAKDPISVWEEADSAMEMLKAEGATYFRQIFRDEEGLIWGFCGYLWGNRNFWVCLNAPAGRADPLVQEGEAEIPVREIPAVELTPAQEPELPTSYVLPIALVSGVVLLTAGYLLVKKKKS